MKYKNSQTGFSLVEVLVAITLLLLVVTGPMVIISRSNHSTAFASEQVQAFFLAQEGLELAEKGRDDLLLQYFLNKITGVGGITNPMTQFNTNYTHCFSNNGCGLVIASTPTPVVNITNCAGNACLLYSHSGNRTVYDHVVSGGVKTPFTRVIKMQQIMSGSKVQEIKVTSTVTWRTGSLIAGQKVELVTYLANIYDTN